MQVGLIFKIHIIHHISEIKEKISYDYFIRCIKITWEILTLTHDRKFVTN